MVFVSAVVYGLCLVCLYACSALSHLFHASRLRKLFRQLDQAFIFLVMVTTYTPFSIAHLHSPWWWVVLGSMWAIALSGFVAKLFYAHQVENTTIWIYVLLGWIPTFGGMPFSSEMPMYAIGSILGGGAFFTVGAVFLLLDSKCWYFHPIWHLFVIAGSAVHYCGVVHCL